MIYVEDMDPHLLHQSKMSSQLDEVKVVGAEKA